MLWVTQKAYEDTNFFAILHGGEDALEQRGLTDIRPYPPNTLGE